MTSPNPKAIDVFLSYTREDRESVRRLNTKLRKDGIRTWFDLDDLRPGDNWPAVTKHAIADATFLMVCLSPACLGKKKGFFHKELREAVKVAEEKAEQEIYIIPIKLTRFQFDKEELPSALQDLHWVEVYNEEDYQKLFNVLKQSQLEGVTNQFGNLLQDDVVARISTEHLRQLDLPPLTVFLYPVLGAIIGRILFTFTLLGTKVLHWHAVQAFWMTNQEWLSVVFWVLGLCGGILVGIRERKQSKKRKMIGMSLGVVVAIILSLGTWFLSNQLNQTWARSFEAGKACLDNGQNICAIEELTNVLAIDPDYAGAYFYRGQAYFNTGDYQSARTDFTSAIELLGRDDTPRYQARMYCERGKTLLKMPAPDYDKALADFDSAEAIDSSYYQSYYFRGIVYVERQQYREAVEAFTSAIERAPEKAMLYCERGAVYSHLDDWEHAREDFNTVLSISDDPDLRQCAEEALQKIN